MCPGQYISQFILRLLGWRIAGFPGPPPPKYIVAVAPHTSNWDFPLGLLIRSAVGERIHFLGKHTLFYPPLGWIMRALGGFPVDRRHRGNLVDAVVDIFSRHKRFAISIAPEGTRKKVDKLKTGFYYIAKKAGIPILICTFDYSSRTVTFGPLFNPGDDTEEDMKTITGYFKDVKGKHPEKGL